MNKGSEILPSHAVIPHGIIRCCRTHSALLPQVKIYKFIDMPGSVWMWQAACHIRKLCRKGTVRQAQLSAVWCDILVGKSFSESYFEMPNPFQVQQEHISLVFLYSKAGTFFLSFWGAWLYSFVFFHHSGLNAFLFWLGLSCDSAQGSRCRGYHLWRPASPSWIKVMRGVVDEGWTVRWCDTRSLVCVLKQLLP